MKKILVSLVAAASLTLAACSSGDMSEEAVTDPSPTSEMTMEESTPTPTPTPTPTSEMSEDPMSDATGPIVPDAEIAGSNADCADIKFNFSKQWEDKGESYQKLWLMPNLKVTNNCDEEIKSIKFGFYLVDDFGERFPKEYKVQQKVNVKPGETWKQDSTTGYDHYDFDDNYILLKQTDEDELVAEIEGLVLAMKSGEKLYGSDSVNTNLTPA